MRVLTHTHTKLGFSALVCFNRFSLHSVKSRCMCLLVACMDTHLQFSLGLDELLISVNTPSGSMLYNSVRYWLSCLSRKVCLLAALIYVGWLWTGTYVLSPLFGSLYRIFLLMPRRKKLFFVLNYLNCLSFSTFLPLHMCSFAGDGLYRLPHHVHPVHTCDRLGLLHNAVGCIQFLVLEKMLEGWNI